MSAAFTPAPWGVQKPNNNDRRRVIALSEGGFDICNRVRSANDAHLIAAAPELYEALRALVEDEGLINPKWDAAKAALRKARGEA